jgi:ABC-type dipeptide/oligopeptide/nickel transport system ATPase component
VVEQIEMNTSEPLLSISLSVGYGNKPAVLRNVALEIAPGEVLGLVGQSGSGKSTLALSILRLLELKRGKAQGTANFQGRDLIALKERELRHIRGKEIGLVLQSPLSSLNPALRIGTQMFEAWSAHARGPSEGRRHSVLEALASVSLPADDAFLQRYPSQISVGQAQRVLIAMAVLHRPSLLIADEPTSALDVITQSEILALFGKLNKEMGMAVLYISHDLLSVASICHRIAILHEGVIVECGRVAQIFGYPVHPYTRRLVQAIPDKTALITSAPVARLAASAAVPT